jgi:hypothetical protein
MTETDTTQAPGPSAPLPPWPAPDADPEQLLAAIVAYLNTLPPIPRAKAAKMLAEPGARAAFGAVRREAIHQATEPRGATYDTVARELGVSWSAINKAIQAHNHPRRAE